MMLQAAGGSSGIGKCIAIECYKQGAFITLVARNEERLLQAKKEIEKHCINDKQVVLCISVDVSQDYSQVENVIKQKLMSINYLGSVYPSRAVITTMKERRVKPYNVYVTVAYPPDTDTPGFAEENKTKPLETRLISETTSICTPEQVAKQIVKDAIQGNFNSSVGSDGYMLSSLTCGMSPVTSITEGLQQVVTMGLFRMISLFYLGSFDNIIRRCMIERAKYGTADKTA
ncbi:3-ketodihydrosphingosine reductase [Myotis davidii]|uniref:3-ketodihydrosphingosine reductase n=1 Tax=Myotis davidii TaxID=225400 RepID=L5MCL6_MYODS|nr:3-ketodihydrosphingosine reductase [Myotis davidii]